MPRDLPTRSTPVLLLTALCAALLLAAPHARAQGASDDAPGRDVLRYQYLTQGTAVARGRDADPDPSLSLIFREGALTVPLGALDGPTVWFGSAFSRTITLRFQDAPGRREGFVPVLNQRGIVAGAVHAFGSDASLVGYMAIASAAIGDDYTIPLSVGGMALWSWKRDSRTSWGLGASATSELGDPGLVPLFAYRRWSARWTVDLLLPLDANARWWPLPYLSVGGLWQANGGSFKTSDRRLPYDEVRFRTGVLGVVIGLGERRGPHGDLVIGRTLYRRYQVLEDQDPLLTLDFERSTAVGFTFGWAF